MYRASPTTITKQDLSVICTWYLNRIVQSSNVFKGKNPHHHRFGFDPLMHHHEKKTLVIFFSGIESSAMFNHIQLSSWLYMVIFYNVCYNIYVYIYIYTISFHLFSIISTVTSSHQFPFKKNAWYPHTNHSSSWFIPCPEILTARSRPACGLIDVCPFGNTPRVLWSTSLAIGTVGEMLGSNMPQLPVLPLRKWGWVKILVPSEPQNSW